MRHRARLVHKQPVRIEPYDIDEQPRDSLRGKTASTVHYLPPFKFDAQVEFGTHKDQNRRGEDGKPTINSIGVAFIRTSDSAKKEYVPKRNDRITFEKPNILGLTVVWISKAEPTGKSRKDFSLWKITLTDRGPGRNSSP